MKLGVVNIACSLKPLRSTMTLLFGLSVSLVFTGSTLARPSDVPSNKIPDHTSKHSGKGKCPKNFEKNKGKARSSQSESPPAQTQLQVAMITMFSLQGKVTDRLGVYGDPFTFADTFDDFLNIYESLSKRTDHNGKPVEFLSDKFPWRNDRE